MGTVPGRSFLIQRRSFLKISAFFAPVLRAMAQGSEALAHRKAAMVAAGADREGKARVVGVSSTAYKVLTAETGGAMFVMEQKNEKHGGPSRHLHFSQDELFYVVEGEYIVELGSDRFHLKAGDCLLGPRNVPHAWAFAGPTSGRLLLSYAPAGRMEAFFNDREALGIKPGSYSDPRSAAAVEKMRRYGMELLGPPLKLDS